MSEFGISKISLDDQFKIMREESIFIPQMALKYRAWNADDRYMVYDLNSLDFNRIDCTYSINNYNENYIIMPFTNMYDRNGKGIYHSDILLVDEDQSKLFDSQRNHVLVGFHHGSFMYGRGESPLFMNTYLWMIVGMKNACEVVGNLYENIELLGIDNEHRPWLAS